MTTWREETWRPIPGYDGVYEVSNLGRVLSHQPPTAKYPESPRFIGGGLNDKGYPQVHLQDADRKSRTWPIHRLIMLAFIGPQLAGQEVRHLDGDRTNSVLENLAYGTHQENVDDRTRHGTWSSGTSQQTHCKHGHPFDQENTHIRVKSDGRRHRICRACGAARRKREPTGPKTHCKRGHEFTDENTYVNGSGHRVCRTCERRRKREWKASRRRQQPTLGAA